MSKLNKFAEVGALWLVFLLPLFFIPTQVVPLGLAKVILLGVVSVLVFVSVIYSVVRERRISVPGTYTLWAVLALPIVYVASSLLSAKPILSLFGYALEVGTAGSIVIMSVMLFSFAYFFRDRFLLSKAFWYLLGSLSIVALFVTIKVITGGSWFNFNTFFGSMGNPVGAWTDLAVVMALMALVSVFAVEMLSLTTRAKLLVRVGFILSVGLLGVTNFSTAWMLVLAFSIILLIYFATIEKVEDRSLFSRAGVRMAGVLILLSLVFLSDPTISGKTLSIRVADITNVANSDVRPNLVSTMDVTKKVLSENPVLGSGPNTFDKSWLLNKIPDTNGTPFWNVAFPFGFGFLPTMVANVGLLGSLVWLAFLALVVVLGIKSLSRSFESRSDKFLLSGLFFVTVFLWTASFVYPPSLVVLSLAFITTGLFISASEVFGIIQPKEIVLNLSKTRLFASSLVVILLGVGMASFVFVSAKKVLAATHFQRAIVFSNEGKSIDEVESELGRAITTSPSDPYWSAVSQVELSRANQALANTDGNDEVNRNTFQNALSASVAALQNAIALNPTYQNWVALGNIYSSLVPEPLAVDGAYESAQDAYQNALNLHPLSPEIPLLLARLELDNEDIDKAREYVALSLSKKSDYAEAYYFLTQLEIRENNVRQAIESAETVSLLSPNNAGVMFQLGLLKYSNRDYRGAEEALKRALSLVPDYANAQYYLGLTLDKLNRPKEAIKYFEDLAKTNPDNPLVIEALDNLSAGRDALSTGEETSDTSAPIKGQ